jgi:hypothetical protein
VVRWLIAQPECQQFLFNAMKNAGVIEFDLESRRWHGINWQASAQRENQAARL